jgi:uncharacterized membrane protein SpoIIM required for sporulation
MKETRFIDQNKEKWSRFEQLYSSGSKDPEELSDLYMDITDDLSYAQTFYKRRTVRVYLNQLAQMIYTGVHKQKGQSLSKLFTVWKISLPLEIYRSRKTLLFSLVAFLIYCLIGVITTHFNPDFPRIVMGDGYVNMTIENIQNGNPLAVYEAEDQTAMFLMITTNNMKVAFLTFFAGFFFTVGTHILLFSNGVMLGAFQYFFHLKGLLITSFLGIWIHGAFEISAIVLAGGAGITAGNGWLFPGSYTRQQSLQLSVKRGLKIMMSLVPFIIAAGFLESYVTHNYQRLHDWSKWTLILFSFALILFVYVFYPFYVARKYPHLVHEQEANTVQEKKVIKLFKIRSLGEILADSFHLYRQTIGTIFKIIGLTAGPIVLLIMIYQGINHSFEMGFQHYYDWVVQLKIVFGYFLENGQDWLIVLAWSFIVAYIFSVTFWAVSNSQYKKKDWSSLITFIKQRFLSVWAGNFILFACVFLLPWYWLIGVTFLIPLFYLNTSVMAFDEGSFSQRFSNGFGFSSSKYGSTLLVILMTILIVMLLAQPIAFVFSIHEPFNDKPMVRDLLDMVVDFIKRIALIYTEDDYMYWGNIARQIVYLLFVLLVLPFIAITMSILYYSEKEKRDVVSLKEAYKKFGKRSRLQETSADSE